MNHTIIITVALILTIALIYFCIGKCGFQDGGSYQAGYADLYDGAITPDTITNLSKIQLNAILGQVLNQLNSKTGKSYYLQNIDRVNVMPLKKGDIGCEQTFKQTGEFVLGAKYTVDFFAHELANMESRRFITIFNIDTNGTVTVEHLSYTNALLDTNANTPAGQTFVPMSGPGAMIITEETMRTPGKYGVQGVKSATYLDSSPYIKDGSIPIGYMSAWESGQSFLPISFNVSADKYHPDQLWPNRRHDKWWDSNGVFYVDETGPGKIGLDHGNTYGLNGVTLNPSFDGTGQFRPPGIYDNPTVNKLPAEVRKSDSNWMFDLASGDLAMGQPF